MFKNSYKFNNKKFVKMYKYAEEIHGNISLIKMFCEKYEQFEDFYKILPLLKYTYKLTDNLYAEFINVK